MSSEQLQKFLETSDRVKPIVNISRKTIAMSQLSRLLLFVNAVLLIGISLVVSIKPIKGQISALSVSLTETAQEDIATLTPSITPTLSRLRTRTPSPSALCPMSVNTLPTNPDSVERGVQDFDFGISAIAGYLNAGGTSNGLQTILRQGLFDRSQVTQVDVTGDSVPEIVVNLDASEVGSNVLEVFWCQSGNYVGMLLEESQSESSASHPKIATIMDLNGDNVPEIVYVHGLSQGCVDIFEWQGHDFANLDDAVPSLRAPCGSINGLGPPLIRAHGNGTYEIVLRQAPMKLFNEGGSVTERWKQIVWAWNGVAFTQFCSYATETAVYRIQAVLDGDDQLACQHHDKALLAYQSAIFENGLLGWSDADSNYSGPSPTPATNEYPLIDVYARYRIILIHLVQHDIKAAQTDYTILEQTFPAGNTEHPFAELATAFWEAYLPQKSLAAGCQKAVAYATQHPAEIIEPFSKYHFLNVAKAVFTLSDDISQLCPFRWAVSQKG